MNKMYQNMMIWDVLKENNLWLMSYLFVVIHCYWNCGIEPSSLILRPLDPGGRLYPVLWLSIASSLIAIIQFCPNYTGCCAEQCRETESEGKSSSVMWKQWWKTIFLQHGSTSTKSNHCLELEWPVSLYRDGMQPIKDIPCQVKALAMMHWAIF